MMNSTVKRLISLLLVGVLTAALLTACGDKAQDKGGEGSGDSTLAVLSPDVFADYELTLVNAFATWCSPCVKEIPELDQLHKDFADKNVNVIGVVLDTVDPNTGNMDSNALTAVEQLREKSGVTYDFYAPDYTMFDGGLATISSVPTTFFVDNCGNIVGEVYVGARSLKDWTTIMQIELGRSDVAAAREGHT